MVKFAVRLLWLVSICWTGLALSQDDEVGLEAQAKISEAQTSAVSEPSYEVLDRMRNFRGPYTNLDDPVRALERKREIARVGVDMSAPACKPPSCNMGEGSVIVKLANTKNLYKGGDPSITGRCRVDLFRRGADPRLQRKTRLACSL